MALALAWKSAERELSFVSRTGMRMFRSSCGWPGAAAARWQRRPVVPSQLTFT
jgi:hypothetical protein